MLEVHITLIREDAYSTNEYDLVHNWLEKRVWLAEQGPGEGQLDAGFRWIPDPGPPNHHKIRKTLGYLMWGVADQNSEYFTAGVRGVDAYHNVLRSDGSITTEHFHDKACQTGFGDHGCRSGLSLGNETGKFYALAAIVMHNQGIDVREKYPKIEKNIEWTTQVAVDPTIAMKWIGNIFVASREGNDGETFSKEGIVMDWARNWSPLRKNLSHIYLWDKFFQTNYADNLKSVVVIDQGKEEEQIYNHTVRRAFDFGIADAGLITFNPDEVITGLKLNDELESGGKVKIIPKVEEVEASSLFDGRYHFDVFRYSDDDGAMKLGFGYIEIKNGEIIIEKDKRYLKTGPAYLYDTFKGQIDEKGKISASVELDILGGKDRTEVYNLNGQIDKKISGNSPDEDYFTVYLLIKQ
jgi:hypothetical protein